MNYKDRSLNKVVGNVTQTKQKSSVCDLGQVGKLFSLILKREQVPFVYPRFGRFLNFSNIRREPNQLTLTLVSKYRLTRRHCSSIRPGGSTSSILFWNLLQLPTTKNITHFYYSISFFSIIFIIYIIGFFSSAKIQIQYHNRSFH